MVAKYEKLRKVKQQKKWTRKTKDRAKPVNIPDITFDLSNPSHSPYQKQNN